MTGDFQEKACRLRNAVEPVGAGVYFARRRTRPSSVGVKPLPGSNTPAFSQPRISSLAGNPRPHGVSRVPAVGHPIRQLRGICQPE
jgi:hypothetical protein